MPNMTKLQVSKFENQRRNHFYARRGRLKISICVMGYLLFFNFGIATSSPCIESHRFPFHACVYMTIQFFFLLLDSFSLPVPVFLDEEGVAATPGFVATTAGAGSAITVAVSLTTIS